MSFGSYGIIEFLGNECQLLKFLKLHQAVLRLFVGFLIGDILMTVDTGSDNPISPE